jgi:hypothetical protein
MLVTNCIQIFFCQTLQKIMPLSGSAQIFKTMDPDPHQMVADLGPWKIFRFAGKEILFCLKVHRREILPHFFWHNLSSGMQMVGCVYLKKNIFTHGGGKGVFMLSALTGSAQNDGFPLSRSTHSEINSF